MVFWLLTKFVSCKNFLLYFETRIRNVILLHGRNISNQESYFGSFRNMKSDSLTFWYERYSRHLYFLVDVIDKIEIKLHLTSEHVQCINENHITTFNSLIWLPVFNIKNCFDFLSSSYHQHLLTAAESFFLLT